MPRTDDNLKKKRREIGARVRRLRNKHDLTLRQLATRSRLAHTTLYYIELGESSVPGENAPLLADSLGVTVDSLLGVRRRNARSRSGDNRAA